MLELTDRVKALRDQVLSTEPTLRAERSLLAARAYSKYSQEPPVLLRARVLEEVLKELPINILDQELIVGLTSDTLNAAQIFLPENGAKLIAEELDTLSTREQDKFLVTEETKKEIRALTSFWQGKTINEKITEALSEEDSTLLDSGVFFIQKDVGYGHCLADYKLILEKGFRGIKEEADNNLLSNEGTEEQKNFWRAASIVCKAVMDYSLRYSELAKALAHKENNPKRKKELLNIAAICSKVPASPAEDFHEALQSLWLSHMIIQIESDGTGVSFGRFDQYMLPYYKASLKKGAKKEELQELLDCFWIKTNHLLKYRGTAAAKLWSGYIMNQNITIGGMDRDNKDATNDLSYMCLESQGRLGLKEPQFSLRVAENTPMDLLKKTAEVLSTGGGKPQLVSDPTITTSLNKLGVPLDEAKDFGIIGCVEPGVVGGWGRFKSGHINLPKILELVIYNGYDPIKKCTCGIPVGNPESYNTFEDFLKAFEKEFSYALGRLVGIQKNITHKFLEEEMPHVYLSTLFPDCISKGKDFTQGGGKYSWSSFTITGMANVIDSLYTIKKLVFEDKEISFEELKAALAANFNGYELLLRRIKSLPKYGNDIDEVDKLGEIIANKLYDTADKLRGHHNSKICLGYVTVTKSVSYGRRTGATPDGRLAFEAFADGISPTHCCDVMGPTAVMKSSGKLNLIRAGEGCILNQKFIPSSLKEDYQREAFANYVKAYLLDLGGLHVQFNIVSKESLLEAQKHPERYKNLLVRVSGFSAYFVDLSREVQEDVIGRTEFQRI